MPLYDSSVETQVLLISVASAHIIPDRIFLDGSPKSSLLGPIAFPRTKDNMGVSSSKPSTISIRRNTADAAPPAAEEAAAEGEDQKVVVVVLEPRWVRDRNTGQQYVEMNRRRIDMLERRGEVTRILREQGRRFFTRHKDGTMQMDPKRASVGGYICQR